MSKNLDVEIMVLDAGRDEMRVVFFSPDRTVQFGVSCPISFIKRKLPTLSALASKDGCDCGMGGKALLVFPPIGDDLASIERLATHIAFSVISRDTTKIEFHRPYSECVAAFRKFEAAVVKMRV